MQVTSTSFEDGGVIPAEYAFCVPSAETHVSFGGNRNPEFSWSDIPDETRSLALVVHDQDVPTKPDDVNQEGREVPSDLPRTDFYHWVLVDIPPSLATIRAGSFSEGVTARGKDAALGPHGTRQGVNDYVGWFAGDEDMEGTYLGYDGPCPPWNDSLIHHYEFTLFALNVDRAPVEGDFTGPEVLEAIDGHILDSASIKATYTVNPGLV